MSKSEGQTGRRRRHRGRPGSTSPRASRKTQPTQARLLAVRVLDRVERLRAYADLALHHHLAQSSLSVADRALATELVYGTLRWRGRLDYLLSQVLEQPLAKLEPPVASTLRVGAYQLLFSDRIPPEAAVDESVRCIRALGLERATGLVNAVLRRLARECHEIPLPGLAEDPLAHLTHALSLPGWIAERWLETYGPEEAAALAASSNEAPPLCVRANPLATTREALLAELLERFPEAALCRRARYGLVLGRRGDPGRDPAFVAGRFSVQDEGSQLVVGLLDPQPGELVLDACAAPGTKTCAIAERQGGTGGVLALDRHPRRLGLVARATRRLSLDNVHTLERDVTQPLDDLPTSWRDSLSGLADAGGPLLFDRVLVDVPCSGLGTLRRNPDARWRVQPGAPRELSRAQQKLLSRAAAVLRPGGTLVYSTCTLLCEENEEVVTSFLERHPQFQLVGPDGLPEEVRSLVGDDGFLRCLPHLHDTDGFFAARMERMR